MTAMRIGIIGCGNISPAYLKYLQHSDIVQVVAVADVLREKAQERAEEFGIKQVLTVEEMLQSPDVELILNLTVPSSHAAVNIAALEHGKHVYAEKPLSISLEEAKYMLQLAETKNLRIGCAPDTFLGAGIETSRRAIQSGMIGRPIGATAFMMGAGPESWHPNPDFFYAEGGGPMFDMGPYYLTALVQLLGPIRRISGAAVSSLTERTVKSGPRAGTTIPVSTPTHYSGTLEFAGGAVGTLVTSFDVAGGSTLPYIEIYGTEGTVLVPDPNRFDGEVKLRRYGEEAWSTVPHAFEGGADERGKGIEDMVKALHEDREHRASGQLAFHVLEAMHAFATSYREGKHIVLESTSSLVKALERIAAGEAAMV